MKARALSPLNIDRSIDRQRLSTEVRFSPRRVFITFVEDGALERSFTDASMRGDIDEML